MTVTRCRWKGDPRLHEPMMQRDKWKHWRGERSPRRTYNGHSTQTGSSSNLYAELEQETARRIRVRAQRAQAVSVTSKRLVELLAVGHVWFGTVGRVRGVEWSVRGWRIEHWSVTGEGGMLLDPLRPSHDALQGISLRFYVRVCLCVCVWVFVFACARCVPGNLRNIILLFLDL
jgi:hypothetical protein